MKDKTTNYYSLLSFDHNYKTTLTFLDKLRVQINHFKLFIITFFPSKLIYYTYKLTYNLIECDTRYSLVFDLFS